MIRHIYSLVLVLIGWVFFFSPTLGGAVDYIQLMFGVGANGLVDSEGLYLLTRSALIDFVGDRFYADSTQSL